VEYEVYIPHSKVCQTPERTYFEGIICIFANSTAICAPTLALFLIRAMSETVLKK
jgi:hypothetical protein